MLCSCFAKESWGAFRLYKYTVYTAGIISMPSGVWGIASVWRYSGVERAGKERNTLRRRRGCSREMWNEIYEVTGQDRWCVIAISHTRWYASFWAILSRSVFAAKVKCDELSLWLCCLHSGAPRLDCWPQTDNQIQWLHAILIPWDTF
jgi:hypothetical protein